MVVEIVRSLSCTVITKRYLYSAASLLPCFDDELCVSCGSLIKQVISAKLMKRATALAVPVRRLSLSISSHFCRNSPLKCAPQPKIAKKTLKPPILGFQGDSRSSMSIPLNSSSPVQAYIYAYISTTVFYARKQNASRVFAIVWASVRLSHSRSVSKQCKLGSRNLHCGLPEGLQFIVTKFRATGCRGSPQTRASKRGNHPLKRRYFAVIGSNNVKKVADRYIYAVYHNKHW